MARIFLSWNSQGAGIDCTERSAQRRIVARFASFYGRLYGCEVIGDFNYGSSDYPKTAMERDIAGADGVLGLYSQYNNDQKHRGESAYSDTVDYEEFFVNSNGDRVVASSQCRENYLRTRPNVVSGVDFEMQMAKKYNKPVCGLTGCIMAIKFGWELSHGDSYCIGRTSQGDPNVVFRLMPRERKIHMNQLNTEDRKMFELLEVMLEDPVMLRAQAKFNLPRFNMR